MDRTVAILGKLLQDVTHASLGTDDCIPGNPEPLSQSIRRLEANAMDIQSQTIGILPYLDNGLVAIGLVNPHGTSRPHAMRVQEDHDLSNDFLGFPGFNHPLFAFRVNAVERTRRNDAECLRLELQAMCPIVHPDALTLNVLTWDDRCGCAHDGD